MGRGDHNRATGKNHLAQTPKNQIVETDGFDVEYSQELADHDDKVAQERSNAAARRVRGK